jgi:glycosyltransferase involved in cell wall biosynthesis
MEQRLKHPAISVVMPLYNKEHEVNRAIQSILSQTFADFEVIVVNDGSTDGGPERVRAVSDLRIRIIDQLNVGVSAARNRGIAEALGNLVAFLDADDEWEPDFLDNIVRLRDKFPSCMVFATNYYLCGANDYRRLTIIRGLPKGFREGILNNYFKIAAQSDPPLSSSSVAVTKRAIESIGGFPLGVTSGEDLLTWARLASRYDIAFCIEPKAFFWRSESLTTRPNRRPNIPDIVGHELSMLFDTGAEQRLRGLREYLALWHRMRAIFYIQLDERTQAVKEISLAFKYFPSVKLVFLFLIVLLPLNLTREILSLLRLRWKTTRRE